MGHRMRYKTGAATMKGTKQSGPGLQATYCLEAEAQRQAEKQSRTLFNKDAIGGISW